MSGTLKSISVTQEGQPDGFEAPLLYKGQVGPDGTTRLVVSAPVDQLPRIHRLLIEALSAPLGVLWVQLVERSTSTRQEDSPKRWISLEQEAPKVLDALSACTELLYEDGRGQLWIRGSLGEQLVLDELGLIYLYPDDPSFREVLEAAGVEESDSETMAERDYVRVEFVASADALETTLLADLSMQPMA
jgi:hypothetical protein